jgi:hypothetical protein
MQLVAKTSFETLKKHLNISLLSRSKFLALAAMSVSLSASAAGVGNTGFAMCGSECNGAKYYVGYSRTNQATLNQAIAKVPSNESKIYPQTADIKKRELSPKISEQKINLGNDNSVSSIHRIEDVRVGFMKKSELMNVNSKSTAQAQATVKLIWGDTLTVVSKTLPDKAPVAIQIQRNMGGFGSPVTDFAHYNAKSQTFLNRKPIPTLEYSLEKRPGAGEKDREQGQAKSHFLFKARVGDVIKLESVILVKDGVLSGSTPQTLNGADSVEHRVKVLTLGAQLHSESGAF